MGEAETLCYSKYTASLTTPSPWLLFDWKVAAPFHGLLPDDDLRLLVLEYFRTPYGKTILQHFRLACRKWKAGRVPRPNQAKDPRSVTIIKIKAYDRIRRTPIGPYVLILVFLASFRARPEYFTILWIVNAGKPMLARPWKMALWAITLL